MNQLLKKYYKLIILFVVLYLLGSSIIEHVQNDKKNEHLKVQTQLLQTKYDTNYKYLKIMSQDIYLMLSENKKIIKIFKQIKNSNTQERAILREKLYNLLIKKYIHLKNMGVEQINFYLPNNISFLRMDKHKNGSFGNNLTNIRYSVAQTNEYKHFYEGFEIGHISYGFRFVYPIYDKAKRYLGSFEISFSSKKLLENIMDNSVDDMHFLVSKQKLEEKMQQKTLIKNYKPTWETSDFLLENISHTTTGNINLYKKIQNNPLKLKISTKLKEENPFAISTIYKHNNIILNFMPIKNTQNEITAYIVTYTKSEYLNKIILETYYIKFLYYSVLLLSFLFGTYVIQNKNLLQTMAHYDTLTKLPNRSYFYMLFANEISRALRHKNKLALMFIDLDGFKQVNDTYGHNVGDQLLIEVAQRLKFALRATDTVARLGGDEFTVIASELKTHNEALAISKKIIHELNKNFIINDKIINIGASIGIAIYPDHGIEIDTLMQHSDDMMYKAKNNGKNNAIIYKKGVI